MSARTFGPGVVGAAVVLGVVVGERRGPSPARLPLVLAVALLATALLCAQRRRGALGLGCCAVAAVLAGWAMTARALDGQARSPLTAAVAGRESAVADVTLTTDPQATRFSAAALARVDRVDLGAGWRSGGGRTVVLDAGGRAATRLGVVRAGDHVRLRGYFRPLDPYEAHARWRHAVGTLAADDVLAFHPARSPLPRLANWLRSRVLAGHARMPEPQRALVAGFLLGDTTDLPDLVVAEFRASGLSHLVAVSGHNVAVVLALAGPLVRRGHRAWRVVGGVGVLVVFVAMTRFEPSVLRASAMAACSMVGLAVGRPTAGLRSLALAATVLLLADPFLLHSVGFLLSCAASAGIAALGPRIARVLPGPRPLAESVAVTVGAQVAVAPLLLVVFGNVPLVSVPANVVVAPVAGPLTVLGLVGGAGGGLVGDGPVRAALTLPAYACASAVLLVARVAATAPLALAGRQVLVGLLALGGLGGLAAGAWVLTGVRRATWRRARARAPEPRVAVPPR